MGARNIPGLGNNHGAALMNDKKNEAKSQSMEFEALELMGIFLAVFGVIVTISVLIPENWTGRIANLTAGGLLLLIGLWAFVKGRGHRKS